MAANTGENTALPTLGIVGAGRVGGSLGRALAAAGYPVVAVWSRTAAHAADLAVAVGAHTVASPAAVAGAAELTLLAVPDAAIGPVAAELARACRPQPGGGLVHLSGTHGAVVLAPARAAGMPTGAFHPLQTFPSARAPLPAGTTFALEAAGPLRATLVGMAAALGCRIIEIAGADRPLYHAAAVMTANYAVTLMAQAVGLLAQCGIEDEAALAALLPLLRGAVAGLEDHGLPAALTGPIARGDVATVQTHLAALRQRNPPAARVYHQLAEATLPLAAQRGQDPATLAALARALEQG